MLKLTREQAEEIREAGDRPLTFTDAHSQTDYVVMKAAEYERLCVVHHALVSAHADYPIWSPDSAYGAAAVLMAALDTPAANP